MKIYVVDRRDFVPDEFPSLTLDPDKWDDFGFKTTFFVTLWKSPIERVDLLDVKIARMGMTSGPPILPSVNQDALPEDCGSLGANYDYYKRVRSLGYALSRAIFLGLRDLAFDPDRRSMFEREPEPAYQSSLLRLPPARDALDRMILENRQTTEAAREPQQIIVEARIDGIHLQEDAGTGLVGEGLRAEEQDLRSEALRILFAPPARKDRRFAPEKIDFNFAGPSELPSNLIALVGPNGTGKTSLLAELALSVFFGPRTPNGQATGTLDIATGAVRDVIFISYSAYDSFEIPQGQELGADARDDLARQGYVYVGLRKLTADDQPDSRTREHHLKSIQEIDDEFSATLDRLRVIENIYREDRETLFAGALRRLLKDPSLAAISTVPRNASDLDVVRRVRELFPSMSTGHKAIMNIIASLCLRLNRNSLVMMDEPEAHLHPPLVATLLKIVRELLRRFDAYAIVATHSPIVVQETLGQHVLLFDRKENNTSWMPSTRQTFGENIAALTREIFGLPAEMTDFIGVLEERLAKDPSLANLEALFGPLRLSSPARAQALRILAKRSEAGRP